MSCTSSQQPVDAQLQNVFDTFNIDKALSPEEKLDQLRAIPASSLVKRIFDLETHTFRAVTDNEIIPSTLLSDLHTGVFATRFKARQMHILLGETSSEETLYALTNPPTSSSPTAMLRALHNYYPEPLCARLLTLYTSPSATADPRIASALTHPEPQKTHLLFGLITSDVQVRVPIRVLAQALCEGGVPPQRVVRYRVAFRPECTDRVFPRSLGVTHSADGVSWWFVQRYGFKEEERESVRAWLGRTLIPLVTGEGLGQGLGVREVLCFEEGGEVRVVEDAWWEWLMHVAETLRG